MLMVLCAFVGLGWVCKHLAFYAFEDLYASFAILVCAIFWLGLHKKQFLSYLSQTLVIFSFCKE